MTNESDFNKWLTHHYYEEYNKSITVQRIETTTGNGVPDLLIITPTETWLIESKFETTTVRPEQKAWQVKTNSILAGNPTIIVTLSAYPKTKRLVTQRHTIRDAELVTDRREFTLDNEGFKEFITFHNAAQLV